MKTTLMLFAWLFNIFSVKAQKSIYDTYPVYKGNDLGLIYSPKSSLFRIWAPTAEKVRLIFDV
jgi:pullulanase